jgi:hypothetical protein
MLMAYLSPGRLTAIHHSVDFRDIRFVVGDPAFHFDPGVSAERPLLNPDHQLSWNSEFAQKASCGGGTLEAEDFLKIEDTRNVHGSADLLGRSRVVPVRLAGALFHSCVNRSESAKCELKIHTKQPDVRAQ